LSCVHRSEICFPIRRISIETQWSSKIFDR